MNPLHLALEALEATPPRTQQAIAALRDAIEQEPMFYVRLCSDGTYEGPIHARVIERVRVESGAWSPLYLSASPQPAAPQPVAVPLQQALTLSANRLERLALELPYGSTARSDAPDWANEARTAAAAPQAPGREPLTGQATVDLVKKCRAALAEELAAYDIDPPLHHVKEAHDDCDEWLRAHGITKEGGAA